MGSLEHYRIVSIFQGGKKTCEIYFCKINTSIAGMIFKLYWYIGSTYQRTTACMLSSMINGFCYVSCHNFNSFPTIIFIFYISVALYICVYVIYLFSLLKISTLDFALSRKVLLNKW